MNEPIIELKEISKHYGELAAVDQLSLNIYRGEIFGLLGPNGAGKSTTILMMLGLADPTSGEVRVCGINSTRQPIQVKRKVGYMPDDVGFYEDRSGLDNLIFTAQLNGMSYNEAKKQAERLLQDVGLAEAAHKKVGAYSRGMRQRLGLADVLIKNPEVIILDEPTLGIDPNGVKELLTLIQQLSKELGITVLLCSHHLHQVQQVCDRVGLFVKGRLIAEGDVATLSKNLFKDEPIKIYAGIADAQDALIEALAQIDGVQKVERSAAESAAEVSAAADAADSVTMLELSCSNDITAEIAKTITDSEAKLVHLSKKEYGLDEIYARYFEGGKTNEQLAV